MRAVLDEINTFTFSNVDMERLPSEFIKILEDHRDIELYPHEKIRDWDSDKMVEEFKARITELLETRKKHDGEESNVEGIICGCLAELLHKMMIQDVRKLNLEKLLD